MKVTMSGPAPMLDRHDGQVVSLTVPIYEKDEHQGVLSIDFDVDGLLKQMKTWQVSYTLFLL